MHFGPMVTGTPLSAIIGDGGQSLSTISQNVDTNNSNFSTNTPPQSLTAGLEFSLPGPFVVFQGMRGDGMANTMDSMPVLVVMENSSSSDSASHGNNNQNNGTNTNNNAQLLEEEENLPPGEREEPRGIPDGVIPRTDEIVPSGGSQSLVTKSSNEEEDDRELGSQLQIVSSEQSMDNANIGTSNPGLVGVPQEISRRIMIGREGGSNPNSCSNNNNESPNSNYNDGDAEHESDGSGVLLYESTSSTSSLELIMPSTSNTSDEQKICQAEQQQQSCTFGPNDLHRDRDSVNISADSGRGGLHLPIPRIGYNSILPPIGPLTTNTAAAATAGTSNRNANQTMNNNTHSNVNDDSFVMVQDTLSSPQQQTTIGPSNNNNNQRNISTTTSASLASSTITSNSNSSSATTTTTGDIVHFTSSNTTRFSNMTPQEQRSVKQWNKECRERESQWREEMLHHTTSMNTQSRRSANNAARAVNPRRIGNDGDQQLLSSQWWKGKKSNCLIVFESLPKLVDQNGNDDSSVPWVEVGRIVGELPPGCTVLGMEIIDVDGNSLQPIESSENTNSNGDRDEAAVGDTHTSAVTRKNAKYQFLRIESPLNGYILYKVDRYTYLGPGLPSSYAEPDVWSWRVSCPDGAYVRQGLELTSVHVDTIPYGSFVRVTRKTVNAMGLSRLRIEATYFNDSQSSVRNRALAPSSTTNTSHTEDSNMRSVIGWVSEALNPLSGQSGPVVQPMPFPVPVLYRVTLVGGAVIRSDVELSSSQIGHAPLNSILTIVGRAYSNHPQDRCIERLQLAGGGGWVSVRLNRPPPMDELVLEMVGIDGVFDPNEPGSYHIEKQKQVLQEYNNNSNQLNGNVDSNGRTEEGESQNHVSRSLQRSNTGGDISSINDEEDGETGALENSGELSNACSSMSSVAAVPALYRSGVAVGGGSDGSGTSAKACGNKAQADEMCLICLTETRTATIVHGSTGHIACCLMCARILKGRGDRCPVCRLPIDTVIQQFWA